MEIRFITALLFAFMIVVITVPYVIKFANKIGAVDVPGERKVHQKVVPRIGGLAIFFGYIGLVLLFVPE